MWSVKLTDQQRDALRALIKKQLPAAADEDVAADLEEALEALDLSRWDDLPEASLPWDRVAELAGAQGIGEADVVWDLAAGMATAPGPRSPRRTAPSQR
jgi:hypothetical protein